MTIFLVVFQVVLIIYSAAITIGSATYLKTMPLCSDYEMKIVNSKQCVSRCPIRCIKDVCFEDGACPCDGYYLTSSEDGLICGLDCLPGCKSAGGYCASTDLCLCRKGFVFDAVTRRCRKYSILLDRCKGKCLYGKCTYNGECSCATGYRRTRHWFGQLCTPTCKQDCGPHGYCYLPNMCACKKKHQHYEDDGKCHKY